VFSPDRLVILLTSLTTLLFQTHWIDDVGTDERDVLGITVSIVGSMLLLTGLVLRKSLPGRGLLVVAFLSVAFVSAADLCGLNAAGDFAPDLGAHWRDNLGWGLTLSVALTLLLSLGGATTVLTSLQGVMDNGDRGQR
jgi:hypothetical protein